jgi:hypothetical protein
MGKSKINYQHGKIYKVLCLSGEESDTYYGSTAEPTLARRMVNHRSQYKAWKNGTGTKITAFDIFDKYGLENCKILLVENYPCNSKDELSAREGEVTKQFLHVNKKIEGRTRKDYYVDNKNKFSEYQKDYNSSHKDKISEYQKDYYLDNKDKRLDYQKTYYTINKEKQRLDYNKEKVSCSTCNCNINKYKLSQHINTKKHLQKLTENKELE